MRYTVHPISEKSLTVYFDQVIDEKLNDLVISSCNWLKQNPFKGFIEVVPAFASFSIFYDLVEINRQKKYSETCFQYVSKLIDQIPFADLTRNQYKGEEFIVPVRYTGKDLKWVSDFLKLPEKEIILYHTSKIYRVYMMGFLPGFAYLGGVDDRLVVPRKKTPEIDIEAGSVGLAGNQTGVYPVSSPGGWQIIGHTSFQFFDPAEPEVSVLQAGDRVRFIEMC